MTSWLECGNTSLQSFVRNSYLACSHQTVRMSDEVPPAKVQSEIMSAEYTSVPDCGLVVPTSGSTTSTTQSITTTTATKFNVVINLNGISYPSVLAPDQVTFSPSTLNKIFFVDVDKHDAPASPAKLKPIKSETKSNEEIKAEECSETDSLITLVNKIETTDAETKTKEEIKAGECTEHLETVPLITLVNKIETTDAETKTKEEIKAGECTEHLETVPLITLVNKIETTDAETKTKEEIKAGECTEHLETVPLITLVNKIETTDAETKTKEEIKAGECTEHLETVPLITLVNKIETTDAETKTKEEIKAGECTEHLETVPLITLVNKIETTDAEIKNKEVIKAGECTEHLETVPLISLVKTIETTDAETKIKDEIKDNECSANLQTDAPTSPLKKMKPTDSEAEAIEQQIKADERLAHLLVQLASMAEYISGAAEEYRELLRLEQDIDGPNGDYYNSERRIRSRLLVTNFERRRQLIGSNHDILIAEFQERFIPLLTEEVNKISSVEQTADEVNYIVQMIQDTTVCFSATCECFYRTQRGKNWVRNMLFPRNQSGKDN